VENAERDAFVRWQGRTIDQLSYLTNLLIGLATGLLALEAQGVLDGKICAGIRSGRPGLASMVLLALSLGVGLLLACNRLRDFRKTARSVRDRNRDAELTATRRRETQSLGDWTWRLLWVQVIAFALGTLAFLLLVVLYTNASGCS